MIASGVKRGFTFQGVVGIDHGREKEPDLFRTWNGKKSVYVLDEDGKPLGISTHDDGGRLSGQSKNFRGSKGLAAKRKRKRAKRTVSGIAGSDASEVREFRGRHHRLLTASGEPSDWGRSSELLHFTICRARLLRSMKGGTLAWSWPGSHVRWLLSRQGMGLKPLAESIAW